MQRALSPYLAPLLAFGPVAMVMGVQAPYAGDSTLLSLIQIGRPYVGAIMLTLGAIVLLMTVQRQQKDIADLRAKLESIQR